MLKTNQHQQDVNFSQESSQTPLKAKFLALKCFIKGRVKEGFVKLLKRYHKNLIKYFIGNALRIYGMKLHQEILLLV